MLKKTSKHGGLIEEVVWPQYGGTWGRRRRRGGQNLEDPEMFLKSSLSLLILKVGSSTPLSLFLVSLSLFGDFVTVDDVVHSPFST